MSNQTMIINAVHPEEFRVALVEGQILEGFFIETASRGKVVGNIYKAIITHAQGEVTVRLEENGQLVDGRAVDTDIVLASAKALVDGLNKLDRVGVHPVISEFTDEESYMPRL